VYPVWSAMALMLISAHCMLVAELAPQHRMWLCAAGLCTGLIAWFRYDVTVFVLFAEVIFLGWVRAGDWRIGQVPQITAFLVDALWLVCGATVALVPLLVFIQSNGALEDLLEQVIGFPRQFYMATRYLPFPPPWRFYEWSVYLPITVTLSAALLYRPWRLGVGDAIWNPSRSSASRATLLFALLSICLYPKGLVRTSSLHLALAIVPSALFLAASWGMHTDKREPRTVGLYRCLQLCVLIIGVASIAALGRVSGDFRRNLMTLGQGLQAHFSGSTQGRSNAERSVTVFSVTGQTLDRFVRMNGDAAAAARWVRRATRDNELIFVGTGRHDKIFVNDASLYFVAQRRPATKWHHYDPGIQNSFRIQSAMIREMESGHVNWIVLASDWDDTREPNDSAVSTGVTALDVYIRDRFRLAQQFGTYSVWSRRDVPSGDLSLLP
jgi:hypothetical protein